MITKAIIFIIIYFISNKFFIKKNILLDKIEISKHKSEVLTNNSTPLTGGLILIIFLFFIPIIQDKFLIISIFLIYVLGLLSDLNILSSPSKRIFFQSFIIISFIFLSDLEVKTISIDFFDRMLELKFFNVLFLLSCLLVLVNGTNFIDGLNTLVINYFLIVLITIYFSSIHYNLNLDYFLFNNLIMILAIISIFNFFGKSFLGDSGTYSLAFLMGIICIEFIFNNSEIVSPYFVALLLWYPAIENLFSIIRRTIFKKKLSNPDNLHLHHLIYNFIKKKNFFQNKILLNSLSGILINFYNLLVIFLSSQYLNNSKSLVMILFFNIVIYLVTYFFLKNFKTR